jgi:hypothetical protein
VSARSSSDDPAQAARWRGVERASRRAWRIALVAYLVPVSIATHWPRLGFGGGGVIDKFVHFLAFGVLAWLWMEARPFGRAWLGFAIGAAWVYLDEVTQAIEILGRVFSPHDMIAGWIGVAVAGALHVLRERTAPPASDARRDGARLRRLAYAEGAAWIRAAAVTAAVLVPIAAAFVAVEHFSGRGVFFGTVVYAVGFGGFVGVVAAAVVVEARARLGFTAIAGRPPARVPRSAAPFWTVLLVPIVALALGAAYLAGARALFGVPVPEELANDAEGFRILQQGFGFAGILVAFAVADFVGVRLACRANPTLARAR